MRQQRKQEIVAEPALNPDNEERPLLFVDINLGDDQVERIVVYEGNTASELALQFSNKHGKMILTLVNSI